MKEQKYLKEKHIYDSIFERRASTLMSAIGIGLNVAGSITQNKAVEDAGTAIFGYNFFILGRAIGRYEGEHHFYKEDSKPDEKSKLIDRIKDFYFPKN